MKNSSVYYPLSFRVPQLPHPAMMIGLLLVWIIGFIFYIEQICRPATYDAVQYWEIARDYNIQGIMDARQEVRTFVYPWILSLVLKVSNIFNLPKSFLLYITQNLIYFLSILGVTNVIFKYSKHCATLLYIMLCANFFVLPYIGISLSDALYTCLCLMLFAWMINLEHIQKSIQKISITWVFVGIGIMSVAIAMRPAAIWLALPTFYCLIKAIFNKKINLFDFLIGMMLGAIPLYIQIAINVTNFKVVSFLPVIDLGALQIKWGIENIKVSAWLGGDAAPLNYYPAGNLITMPSEFNILWYFKNPVDAIKLLSFKLVGAFDL